MNVYDKIKSPIESDEDMKKIINIYADLREKNQLDKMYNKIVKDEKKISKEEEKNYIDNYFEYIVEPFTEEMAEKVKSDEYIRFDESFIHLYQIEQMKEMFEEKSAKEIIEKGRILESRNQPVFDKLNSLFWNNGNKDRKEMYIQYLKENNIEFNKEEKLDWMDYRAITEEFQNPKLMGFHCGEPLKGEEKMKMYINVGEKTYELANMFYNNCKEKGIDTKFKVAIGNMSSEINRVDKMCIYIDDLEKAKEYIEILTNIKEKRGDFKFQTPMITAGKIDNWIGIGTDIDDKTSYNKDFCDAIVDICDAYFENKSETEIYKNINKNETIDNIRNRIQRDSLEQGRSFDKICIRAEDTEELKRLEINEPIKQGCRISKKRSNSKILEVYFNEEPECKIDRDR